MSNLNAREEAFVKEELAQWTPLLQQRMREQLTSRNIKASGALLRSMVAKLTGVREVQLAFLTYGRFHDMGALPGWRKGQYVGNAARAPRAPKPSLFYSRTKMGLFGQLVSNLSNKYLDLVYEQAVSELKPAA